LDFAYAKVTLDAKQRRQFATLLRWLIDEVGEASLFVHLTCPPHIELERIRRRGRSREQAISESYLADINDQLANLLARTRTSVFVLNSHTLNFATNSRTQKRVLAALKKFVVQRLGRSGTKLFSLTD
jgi:deoxyadenosine/deoxycytidine kinase